MDDDEKTSLLSNEKNSVKNGGHISEVNYTNEKLPLFAFSRRRRNRRLRNFYAGQDDMIEKYDEDRNQIEVMEEIAITKNHDASELFEDADKLRKDKYLAIASFTMNVLLLIAKATVAYLSNSLSVISSVIDSAVDITSGVVIFITARKIEKHDPYLYPRGRTKLEPLAVIIVAIIMAVASIQVVIQSIQEILDHKINPDVGWTTIGTMIAVIAVKFVLAILCWRQGTSNSMVLAIDHRNDCVSNTVAIICAYLGSSYWIYIDPIGAIIVAFYIVATWAMTAVEQMPLLTGKAADDEYINRIIRICVEHDPKILALETLYVYHYGAKFLVEVHIMLDEETELKVSHDVSEGLQRKLEHLSYVERAFVHCDYGADTDPCPCGKVH